MQVRRKGDDLELVIGSRQYRVRGLAKNTTYDVLKVNVRVLSGSSFHIDTLDLYNARHRSAFINTTADELRLESDIIKKDMGRVLLKLEELQDDRIKKALEPKKQEVKMTDQERREALSFLKDPHLLERIVKDFEIYGLVGEETNRLVGYLSVISRKLEKPLAVVIQSSSASGKSTLLEALLSMVPEEDRIQYSAMTGQSLFYLGDKDLRHKVLAIVEEEGIKQASYALKLLQSEGKLRIASTGKDATTGQMVTREYQVEGPVMVLTTSTAIDIDEELLNRCLVLSVDESRQQTRAIHRAQRQAQTLEGLKRKLDKKDTLTIHRNAQRLLQPLEVINNYSGSLTFLDDQTRMRRDHLKYLTLISAIAFLHQYQRPVKPLHHQGATVSYIEVTPADIAIANTLAGEVLGRTLDELSPQTRLFLDLVDKMVKKACTEDQIDRCDYRFTQRDLRKYTGWSDYQVKSHLRKLVSLEYVLIHRGRGQRFVYELLYNSEGKDGKKFLMGLLDADELNQNLFPLAAKKEAVHEEKYDGNREHHATNRVDEKMDREAPGASREHRGSAREHAEK